MNRLLSLLLLVSVCLIEAGKGNEGSGPCKQLSGRCVPSTSGCQDIISKGVCPGRRTCCSGQNRAGVKRAKKGKGRGQKEDEKKKIKSMKRGKGSNKSGNVRKTKGEKGRNMKLRKKDKPSKKRICRKTSKKCAKQGGTCTNYKDCVVLIDADLCKGASCQCCTDDDIGSTCDGAEKKKCLKKNGICKETCDDGEDEINKGCSGDDCKCCAPIVCKAKKPCKKKGGFCVTDPADCDGDLIKGCKGKGCQCCVPTIDPVDPETTEAPVDPETTKAPVDPETTKAPVDPETTKAPVDPETTKSPVDPETTKSPVDPETTKSPVDPETTEAPTVAPPTTKPPTTLPPTTKQPTTLPPTTKPPTTLPPTTKPPTTLQPTTKPPTTLPPTTKPPTTLLPTTITPPATTTKDADSPTTTKKSQDTTEKPTTAKEPTTTINTQTTSTSSTKTVKCGIEIAASQRIVNGVDVSVVRKYSWQVGLQSKGFYYHCGGSIITDKHILTAAHCFYNFPQDGTPCSQAAPSDLYIGIGDHNQDITTDSLSDFTEGILMKQVSIHENYNCATYANDIAIIELSKAIDLVKHADDIHPICLPKDNSKTYAGETATISGWGSTVGYNPGVTVVPTTPIILKEAQVTVKNNIDCNNIPTDQLCAGTDEGFENGGKDTCQGDSGGPLYVKENVQHVQIGVVSYGAGCASKGNPGVYARVAFFLDWIKGKVGSETLYTAP